MTIVTTPLLSALALGLLLDALLGEPERWHPLVGFGRLAAAAEGLSRRGVDPGNTTTMRARGMLAWLLLVAAPALLLAAALPERTWGWPLEAWLLSLTLGAKSLAQHGEAVRQPLEGGDLAAARQRVGFLVSRDVAELDGPGVAKAAVESVLENGCDALFGALFWFLLLGAPGAVGYRLANTLDAMWGYKTPRFLHFGWAAARADDLLNFFPARLTALTYALTGNTRAAWRSWRAQAPTWKSPNAGAVMASGAGALGVRLGGAARYHGEEVQRPPLGEGRSPEARDIAAAFALVRRGAWGWLGVAALCWWGIGHA